jgi:hypothetical protein
VRGAVEIAQIPEGAVKSSSMPDERKQGAPGAKRSPEDEVMEEWQKAQEIADAGGPPVPQSLIEKVFDIVSNPASPHYDREETRKIERPRTDGAEASGPTKPSR